MRIARQIFMQAVAIGVALTAASASGAPAQRIATPIGPDGGEIAWVTVHPHLTVALAGFSGHPIVPDDLSGVWASTDHEHTWHRASKREAASLSLPPTDNRQRDPLHHNVMYRLRPFAAATIVEVSTNGGRTFSVRSRRALRDLSSARLLVVRSGRRTVLIVGAEDGGVDGENLTGIRRSLDGGYTWTTIAGTAGHVTGMWKSPSGGRGLYATVEDAFSFTSPGRSDWQPGTRVLYSRDAGRSWHQLGARVPNESGGDNDALDISPHNSSRMLLSTGYDVYRSGDGGTTWTRVLGAQVSQIVSHPTMPGHVVAASDTGIWVSNDGGRKWTRANTGLKATWADRLLPTGNQGRVYAVGKFGSSRLAVSDDRGASWTLRRPSWIAWGAADPTAPDTLVGIGNEGLTRTVDAGRHWVTLKKTLGAPLAVDPTTRRLYASESSTSRLMYSDDFGDHWHADDQLPKPITSLVAESGAVYATNVFNGNTVWRRNGSGDWTEGAPFGGAVLDLVVAPSRPSTLYATSLSRKVEFGLVLGKSVDGGATWHLLSIKDPHFGPLVAAVAVDRGNSKHIFTAGWAGSGLWSSSDGGLTWSKAANIPGSITEIVQHPTQPNVLYVATVNNGAWRVELTP